MLLSISVRSKRAVEITFCGEKCTEISNYEGFRYIGGINLRPGVEEM